MYRSSFIFILAGAAVLSAQTQAGTDSAGQKHSFFRRFSVELRVRGVPKQMFEEATTTSTTTVTKPANTYTYTYKTTSDSSSVGVGPGVEFRIVPRLFIAADYIHQSAGYTMTNTIVDSASKTATIKETTRAAYWDLPVRLEYVGVPHLPKKMFIAAGGVMRYVKNIRTGTDTTNTDGSTSYSEVPAPPSKKHVPGVMGAIGFRLVDAFGIKVIPEVRYVKWNGHTFNSLSTRSRESELQILLGFGF